MSTQTFADKAETKTSQETVTNREVIFIDWPTGDNTLQHCSLLDGTDISKFKIAFFNPLNMLKNHSLWPNDKEITEIGYVSLSEKGFLGFLTKAKRASNAIQILLKNQGILVIRSNLPKAHIKVSKKTSASTRDYTESLMSVFFWLEELLGRYAFRFGDTRTIKFLNEKNPLRKLLGECGVKCIQTLESVGKGKLEFIAGTGPSFRTPAISRVSFGDNAGQIYFIPEFEVHNEYQKLIESFSFIHLSKNSGLIKPRWMTFYDNQIQNLSPYGTELEKIEQEIDVLQKQKSIRLLQQRELYQLGNLLYENGKELEETVRFALKMIGIDCGEDPPGKKRMAFEATLAGNKSLHAFIQITGTESDPVGVEFVRNFVKRKASRLSKVNAKGIIVANAISTVQPENRDIGFDVDAITEGKYNDICLIPTYQLYLLVTCVLNRWGSAGLNDILNSIRKDILECNSIFEANRRKYAI